MKVSAVAPSARPPTVQAHAREAVPALCAALGIGARAQEATDLFEALTEPWGSRPLEDWFERRSGVAEDQSPYAFTLGLGQDGGDLRFVLEAQADEPSPAAQWSAGRALTKRLSERYGLDPTSLARVEDLFEPQAGARAALWHAAVLRGDAPPRFEVILDAHAQGRWKARAVIEEALVRLGLGQVWSDVAERVLRRGVYLDDLAYLVIELPSSKEGSQPTVKLFVRHYDATTEDLRAALGASPLAARVDELCLALTGSLGPHGKLPLVTCHTFTMGETPQTPPQAFKTGQPSSGAIYVPVAATAPSDAVVRGRVSAYLALQGLPYEAYEHALAGYARRPLAARAGLQSYVAIREEAGGLSVTVELSPDLRAAPAPEASRGDPSRTSVEEIVHHFEEQNKLDDHPLMRRLGREPAHLGHLWALIANFWAGVVHDFPTRISQVVAELDDDRIRCVLTKQMNDELGDGDYAQAHKPMFRVLLEAVEPYRLQGTDDVLVAPGRAFGSEIWTMTSPGDPHERLGRMMMIEIGGKQIDIFMGGQFRRQSQVDAAKLRWLHLHEELEVEHAEDGFTLARYVPNDPAAIAAAWRGAEAVASAGRRYFDALYRICFG